MLRGRLITLGIVVLLISSSRAHAIYPNEGTLAGPCAWASVVRLDSNCSGSLITSNVVLTAAHCGTELSEAKFGETDLNDSERSVDILNCSRHHDYQSETNGPDLMLCEIDEMGPEVPAVPIIPIMVPTGPARDWLRHEIYGYKYKITPYSANRPTPEVIAVGAGCNDSTCVSTEGQNGTSGDKFQGSAWLEFQTDNHGTHTKLRSGDGYDEELNPLTFVDTRYGDSGGPLFVQMRDESWVQIGVLHGGVSTAYNEHEAVPSYLTWVEDVAMSGNNDIITPCHDLIDGEWVWQGDCEDTFPVNPGESYDSDWGDDCSGVTYGGGTYPNAAFTPPSPSDKMPPGEAGGSPLVPLGILDAIYPDALSKAGNGDFGTPATQSAIVQYFFDEIAEAEDAVYPFLGAGYGAGNFGFFDMTVIEGDFDGDSNLDTIYAYPYGDCGKGTLFQELDDETISEWNRDTTGILGAAACGDYFGAAVAVGDFDNDGYDDLAASAPGSAAGTVTQAGSVSVLYGSSSGLTGSGDQIFDQDTSGIGDTAEEHDFVGEALASGDFNCDGYDDLAVGVPREDLTITSSVFDTGLIIVLWGSAGGITTAGSGAGYQGINGIDGSPNAHDQFGAALASGNFNGDTSNSIDCDDLAIGVPFEDVGTVENAGRIYILHGGTSGLRTIGDQSLTQNTTGVADVAEADDLFGANLVAEEDGSLDGLTVQVPGEACSTVDDSVGQHRFYGASSGGMSTSTDVLNCEVVEDEFNSYSWGMREHAVDYYAIRILEEL